MHNQIKLVDLRVLAYAGISPDKKAEVMAPESATYPKITDLKNVDPNNGLVIVFPDGYNYVELESDQGGGKTSVIECLKEATGGESIPNAVNTQVNNKRFEFTFQGKDGELYKVKATKTQFDLLHIMRDKETSEVLYDQKGQPRTQRENAPKTLLKTLVGAAGMSPLELKEKDGKAQVDWLRSLYTFSQEEIQAEKKVLSEIDQTYKARKNAKRDYKVLKGALSLNEYYIKYEHYQKYFPENVDKYADVGERVKEITKQYNTYLSAEQKLLNHMDALDVHKTAINDSTERIRDLEKRLQEEKGKLEHAVKLHNETTEKITAANSYLEENKEVKDKYYKATKLIDDSNEFFRQKTTFEAVVEDKKKLDHLSNETIRLDSRLEELREAKRKFISSFTPSFEGFEVVVPDPELTDDEKDSEDVKATDMRPVGLYYKKKPISHLAESEVWEFAAQLWEKLGVKIVYVENVSSLGSGAIEMFNRFIEHGGYIFASKMNRSIKDLRITFNTKIPL
jgi:hypothetical protein